MPDHRDLALADAASSGVPRRRRGFNAATNQLAWEAVRHTTANQRLDPSADPTHSHWLHKFDIGANTTRIFWGRVVDSIAYANCYKVQSEPGLPTILCTLSTLTSLQPIGAKEYGQLQPGTPVYFLLHHNSTVGLIIAVDPEYMTNSQGGQPDFISQAGRSGMAVDDAHKAPLRMQNNGGVIDFSSGRPYDQTTAGERGWIAETGVGIHSDSFMAYLRADEECGVWAFWHDELLRLAGHNLQIWSACREREDLDSYGQVDSIEGYTPYYYEALGAWTYGTPTGPGPNTAVPPRTAPPGGDDVPDPPENRQPVSVVDALAAEYQQLLNDEEADDPGSTGGASFTADDPTPHQEGIYSSPDSLLSDSPDGSINGVMRPVDAEEWQKDPAMQGYSALEPAFDDQQGFYRLRDFYGYLGQGHKRVLQLPPQPLPQAAQTYPQHLQCPGVYEENLALTGDVHVRTARSYMIVKRMANPSPKQVKRQEDALGDTPVNYRAAGTLGQGPPHVVAGDVALPDGATDDPSAIRSSGFLDSLTYGFNWQGAHPFEYAQQTWLLPEEGDLAYAPNAPVPAFSELADGMRMRAPPAVPLYVDHRYGRVDYYPNMAYWGILPDGTVKIGCGFGAEITLVNGNIYIDAPGDVTIRTGRNFNVMAGQDVCITGRNSVDVVANNKDLRLSANHGLYAVGGLDSCGGVLIESRAVGPNIDFAGTGEDVTLGGVVIKARTSMFGVCAPVQIYNAVDTATPEQWLGHTPVTPSIVMDATGGRIRTASDVFERFLATAALDVFYADGVVNEYWANATNIGTPVSVDGNLAVNGCAIVNRSVESVLGHFFSAETGSFGGRVGDLTGTPEAVAAAAIGAIVSRASEAAAIGMQELAQFEALALPVCDAEFTFRDAEQYHTADFTMFESRWEQMNRFGGGAGGTWDVKPAFTAGDQPTYPYPGEAWVTGTTYRTLDLGLFDLDDGLAYDRGEGLYEDPRFETPVQHVLNNTLPSIMP